MYPKLQPNTQAVQVPPTHAAVIGNIVLSKVMILRNHPMCRSIIMSSPREHGDKRTSTTIRRSSSPSQWTPCLSGTAPRKIWQLQKMCRLSLIVVHSQTYGHLQTTLVTDLHGFTPVPLNLSAANPSPICIEGAFFAFIETQDQQRKVAKCCSMVYVSKSVQGMYLSLETMINHRVEIFDMKQHTCLHPDWSCQGIVEAL